MKLPDEKAARRKQQNKQKAERQRQKYQAQGLVTAQLWLHPDTVELIRSLGSPAVQSDIVRGLIDDYFNPAE